MIAEARNHDVGDHRLGRNAAFDQPWRRRRLHDLALAGLARQLRTLRDQNTELRRHHVESFGFIFADDRHRRPAARAGRVLGLQCDFDPRQMRRQRAAVGAPLGHAIAAEFGVALLRLRLTGGDRLLEVLERELHLLVGQALRLGAELQALELEQQMPQPVILHRQFVRARPALPIARARSSSMSSGRIGAAVPAVCVTARILRGNGGFRNPPRGLNARPIEPVEQGRELYRR